MDIKSQFTTISDLPINELYTPDDLPKDAYKKEIGLPGKYPFTRGIHPNMYRGRTWTKRMFAGFGTPEETNKRFKYLLEHGQTGLSVAFHFPTLMGWDSDSPRARGEVGKCGVAIDSLRDMEVLFDGIPLDKVTTSMTINSPAAILLAMYLAVAEKQGISFDKVGGTIQNDILKEYIAQKTYIFPPKPSMRLITDVLDYCTKSVPRWNTISISGYHIREAGSTAIQELAFTIADGIAYVQAGLDVGLDVDSFAPRLSFFWDIHNDFFEEVAKLRAARRMWARIMKERFKAKDVRSQMMRFHSQTAGCSLTAQQPVNNVVRTTIQAMAAVLGGTQSLHTNSLDETYALPTEESVRIALRTQQIIEEESGVTNTVDPLGGSYFVEALTDKLEEEALKYIKKIDEMGGMVSAIERGFPMAEIQRASYRYQQQVEKGEKKIVGINSHVLKDEPAPEILRISDEPERKQIEETRKLKQSRDNEKVKAALAHLKKGANGDTNLMPLFLDAVKVYTTLGEIVATLKEVFGEYRDPATY
ncbi:MAG: methylmalonyl-CoA mutase [Deltaproteobacteria bacterium RIFCSPHIGHO2_12_FULL_43_9]|nr:MAG: methylmalonyl-CoA mutase [Deltaproteobacteria bacterium RIFCSPHIGHO2_12_FULL_43_9]